MRFRTWARHDFWAVLRPLDVIEFAKRGGPTNWETRDGIVDKGRNESISVAC